jgi:hypothetical protein
VIARDFPDLIGKFLLGGLVLGLLYWASDSPQGYQAFSSELNTVLTVLKAGVVGALIIFVFNMLFVAPYQLWSEAQERANSLSILDSGNSPKSQFDKLVQELRHLATSRELWWAQMHSRDRDDKKMYRELEKVVNEMRRLCPPTATFNFEDDPFIRLVSAAARFGEQIGYARPGQTRGETQWTEFESQMSQVTELFESKS